MHVAAADTCFGDVYADFMLVAEGLGETVFDGNFLY